MRYRKVVLAVVAVLFAAALALAAIGEKGGVPFMKSVDPETAKPGEVVTVSGEYLDHSRIKEVYLTNEKADMKVEIIEQSAAALKFKVPADAAPGRFRLAILTPDPEPMLLEQPVTLMVSK